MFYGARFSEILGVINYIARENPHPANWTRVHEQFLCEGIMPGGPSIRLRHTYTANGLSAVSINGNGWLFALTVTRQRPRTMEDGVWSEMASIVFAPCKVIRGVNLSYSNCEEQIVKRLCFHGGSLLDPEAFQKEMTIIRMFTSGLW